MKPENTAIVIVDDGNDFLSENGKLYAAVKEGMERNGMLANVSILLSKARAMGIPIVHVPLQFSEDYGEMGDAPYGIFSVIKDAGAFQKGSWGAQIFEGLYQEGADIVVNGKSTTCAFATTDLNAVLERRGIRTLALAGLLTNVCIESTMRTAYDKGYEVYALSDCAATISKEQHEAAIAHDWPMFSKPVTHDEFLARASAA